MWYALQEGATLWKGICLWLVDLYSMLLVMLARYEWSFPSQPPSLLALLLFLLLPTPRSPFYSPFQHLSAFLRIILLPNMLCVSDPGKPSMGLLIIKSTRSIFFLPTTWNVWKVQFFGKQKLVPDPSIFQVS